MANRGVGVQSGSDRAITMHSKRLKREYFALARNDTCLCPLQTKLAYVTTIQTWKGYRLYLHEGPKVIRYSLRSLGSLCGLCSTSSVSVFVDCVSYFVCLTFDRFLVQDPLTLQLLFKNHTQLNVERFSMAMECALMLLIWGEVGIVP